MIAVPLAPALLLLAALAANALPREPAERVRALGERYRAHLLAHRPDLALRWRLNGARAQWAPVSAATLRRDAAIVAALRAEAEAVDAAALDAESASLHRMLTSRLAEEEAQSAPGGALWRDPLAWVGMLRDLVAGAVDDARRSACQRTQAVTPVLRAAPELMRAATLVIGGPADREGLRDSLESARHWLRAGLPALALECRDPARLGDFVRADSLAVQALGDFGAFVLADTTFNGPARVGRRSVRGAAGR